MTDQKNPNPNKEVSHERVKEVPNSDIKRIFESDGKKNPPDPTGTDRRKADPDD